MNSTKSAQSARSFLLGNSLRILGEESIIDDRRVRGYSFVVPTIHPTAIIDGDVVIHPTAKIEAHAVIKGPAYIGKDVVIGNLCLVRQSTIEEGTTVGFGSEVARSYVGPRCNLHHTFVGDSVLESEVNMSWGTVTANLRLDKKTVRITLPSGQVVDSLKEKLGALIAKGSFLGVQVSTMPGTLIAAGTKISPATVVPPQKSV
ncbi:MAG: hypothetical protein EBY29_08220 [Planctomycetes bacterium]|nr:hypothetical protein [Planctomycetota bacterium]